MDDKWLQNRVGGALLKEQGCSVISFWHKQYELDNVIVERSLRPHEMLLRDSDTRLGPKGSLVKPYQMMAKFQNEAACLRFLRANTNVPVPKLICAFEDAGAYFMITEKVSGVSMKSLSEEQRKVVEVELEQHMKTWQALTSTKAGGPEGHIISPARIQQNTPHDPAWRLHDSKTADFVFTHGTLMQSSVIVDPVTLKINAITGWDHAGFYPKFFERQWYLRNGPAVAVGKEEQDKDLVLDFFRKWSADTPFDAAAAQPLLHLDTLPTRRTASEEWLAQIRAEEAALAAAPATVSSTQPVAIGTA